MALPPAENRRPRERKIIKRLNLGALLGVVEDARALHNTFTFGALDGLNTHTTYVTLTQTDNIPLTPFAIDVFAPGVRYAHYTNKQEWKRDVLTPGVNPRIAEARMRTIKHLKNMEKVYSREQAWTYTTQHVFEQADVFLVAAPDTSENIIEVSVWPAGHNWRYYGYLKTPDDLLYLQRQLKSGTLRMRRIHPTTNKHYVEFTPGQRGRVWVP